MSTKFILHGGGAQHKNLENDLFFAEVLNSVSKKKLTILLVHFASDESRVQSDIERDTFQFIRNQNNKNLIFLEARKTTFIAQILASDIIYFGGGVTAKLLKILEQFSNIRSYYKDKVIVGESAGANVQCTLCYSKSCGSFLQGLGCLPIFLYPHYNKNATEILDIPSSFKHLEQIYLPEYKYKVLKIQ